MKSKILSLLDAPALIVAMVVDMVLVGLALWIIGPGLLEKIALCLLGAVAVLFAVRAWLKGGAMGIALWVMFAAVAFFLDLSFSLAATDPALLPKAPDTSKIEVALTAADARVQFLQADYRAAVNRATMDQLDGQIKAAQAVADGYRADLRATGSGQTGYLDRVTAGVLSVAIYTAASSGDPGRLSFLVLFVLLFAGLQLTMVTAATETKKQAANNQSTYGNAPQIIDSRKRHAPSVIGSVETPPRSTPQNVHPRPRIADPVARWVGVEWNYVQNGRGIRPLTKDSFYIAIKKSPDQMEPEVWDKIMNAALKSGVIVDGIIMETDKAKAAEKIRAVL